VHHDAGDVVVESIQLVGNSATDPAYETSASFDVFIAMYLDLHILLSLQRDLVNHRSAATVRTSNATVGDIKQGQRNGIGSSTDAFSARRHAASEARRLKGEGS